MALNVSSGNLNLDPAEIERLRMAANPVVDTNQKSNFVDNKIDPEEEIARLGGMSTLINASMFIDGVNVPPQIAERVQREANFANLQDKTGMTIGSGSGGGAIKIITSKDEDGNGIDDEEENGLKEMADAAADSQINQNDYSQTYSEDQLDNMQWQGNQNAMWTIGGRTMSRKNLYDAGKEARKNWNDSEVAKGMSPEDRARVDQQISQYLQAIKNGDQAKAARIYSQMPPSARADIDEQNANTNLNRDMNQSIVANNVQNSEASALAGNDLFTRGNTEDTDVQFLQYLQAVKSGDTASADQIYASMPQSARDEIARVDNLENLQLNASIANLDFDEPATTASPMVSVASTTNDGGIETNIALTATFNTFSFAEGTPAQPAIALARAPEPVAPVAATTSTAGLNTNFGFS